VYARAPTQAVVLARAPPCTLPRQSLSTASNALLFCVVAKNHRFYRCFCVVDFFLLRLDCPARGPDAPPKLHDNAPQSTPIKHVEKIFARALARDLSVAIPIRIARIGQK
jgi:hypothetical protein